MALNEIDSTKIKAPTSTFINEMRKKEADPELYVEWLLLFDEYNKANPTKRKGMGCAPCYGVVYIWYQQELKKLRDEEGGN